MKKKILFAATIAAVVLSGCDNQDALVEETHGKAESLSFTVADFVQEEGSRTNITTSAQFTWAEGDVLGVFPDEGYQTAFPISAGVGTATAMFDGGKWALRNSAEYAAYFPLQHEFDLNKSNIQVSYTGQRQTGNNSTAHLGQYDYIASPFTTVDEGAATFQLSHLGALVKISIVMPEADSYSKISVSTDAGNFKTVARYGLSNADPSLSAVSTATSVELDLSGISTAAPTQSIILYMMMAPTNLSGATLTFSVTGSKSYTGTASGKNMAAGSAYAYSVTCEAPAPVGGSHEYVDLGLPSGTLWATCNVGANAPEEYGDYFAWGETEPYYTEGHSQDNPCENWKAGKSGYNWSNYKWCNGSYNTMTKYCTWSSYGTVDNKTVLESADDAATANWGAGWKMPTQAQMQELYDYTTCTWTSLNGVIGRKFTAKNGSGNFVFLPAAGRREDGSLYYVDSYGYYWSSSLDSGNSYLAYSLSFNSGDVYPYSNVNRYYGFSVRPVRDSAPVEHEYVDLGLPSGTKWATCNVGASAPEEYGDYFAWGETTPQASNRYYWDSYKWCNNGNWTGMTKYTYPDGRGSGIWYSGSTFIGDNKTVLESADDAATANWGAGWKMPTQAQMQELYDYTTCTWTSVNGVNGRKFTAKNGSGNFVFLPAAGYRDGSLYNVGSSGHVWSSSLGTGGSDGAYDLIFDSGGVYPSYEYRYNGISVRPVRGL